MTVSRDELVKVAAAIGRNCADRRVLIAVVGGTGAGKSTVVDALANSGWVAIRPGQAIRAMKIKINPEDAANMSPVGTDMTVRKVVSAQLKLANGANVALDGFPRSPGQAEWLREEARLLAYDLKLVVVEADRQIRMDRVAKRNDHWDKEHAAARFTREDSDLGPFLGWLRVNFKVVMEVFNGIR